MSGLSIPARRYIWGLMMLGVLVSTWEFSLLRNPSRWILPFLFLQALATYLLKKKDLDPQISRRAAFGLTLFGVAGVGWNLQHLQGQDPWLLLGMGSLAAAAHILKQPGPTMRSSYQLSFTIYGFSILAFGAPATLLIVLIAHVMEYTWGTFYEWYIQAFNVATFALAVGAAGLLAAWANPAASFLTANSIIGAIGANLIFILINHTLVGIVLRLARGQSFRESGVLGFLTLMIDFSLLSMGTVIALLWHLNPYAVFLGLIPLYLIYTTLKVPALERQTEIDTKTGVYNAGYFKKALDEELVRAHRFDRPLTLVMADLDLLRDINDKYGHLGGDIVLQGIAQTLQEMAGDYDIVARFGGEEFAILIPESTPEAAQPLIEAMRHAIGATHFHVSTSPHPIHATMSFGIAARQRSGESADALVHRADLALYQAKRTGRNRVIIFSSEMSNGTGPK